MNTNPEIKKSDLPILAIVTYEGIKLWNYNANKYIGILICPETIFSLAFSPDGTKIAAGTMDDTVYIWDFADGNRMVMLHCDIFGGIVNNVIYSPDGKKLISSCDNGFNVWHTESYQLISTIGAHNEGIMSIAISPDGRDLLTSGLDNIIKVWVLDKGKNRAVYKRECTVYGVTYSPNGKFFASAESKWVYIWDAMSGEILNKIFADNFRIAFTTDSKKIIITSLDSDIIVFDIGTHSCVTRIPKIQCDGFADSLCYLVPFKKNTAICNFKDGLIRIYDENGKQQSAEICENKRVTAIAICN